MDDGKVKAKDKSTDLGDGEFDEVNIWKYCFVGGNKPKTINEADSDKKFFEDSGRSTFS